MTVLRLPPMACVHATASPAAGTRTGSPESTMSTADWSPVANVAMEAWS
uniref:Uncharacterized protein n=1 Tax=uncultured Nocardioidaceae bacterium TaxID=253824 RepID=A0A6J4LKV4_9ACTN|nr:MAG: hypothetical protein AVDCRST_MAG46-1682 [uncultured Nocardioidaceae bacterium]